MTPAGQSVHCGESRVLGTEPDVLDRASKKRDYQDKHNGLRTTVWQQVVDGIPVFEAVLKAHTTARGELVNIGSTWVPDAERVPRKGCRLARHYAPKPPSLRAQALAIAGESVGASIKVDEVAELDAPAGVVKRHNLGAPGLNEAWAEFAGCP
jgi:hypothetical protein